MEFRALQIARFTSKKRELMRAGLRLGIAVLTAGLALGPMPAVAQNETQATTTDAPPAPPAETVGPRELQNFTLNGTVTRSAEPAPAQRTATPPRATSAPAAPRAGSAPPEPATATTAARSGGSSEAFRPPAPSVSAGPPRPLGRTAVTRPQSRPSSSVTVALPPLDESPVGSASSSPGASSPAFSSEADGLTSERRVALWPWLLAALALGAGAAFLFWRNRSREAFAGGPKFDTFSPPEPAPQPRPVPPAAPPRLAPGPTPGVVATRLRPRVELVFQPLRCIVEDHQVTIEFEIGLYNSGSAPARAVLVEASMFNAGPAQDQAIGAFFANPAGQGERIVAIAPLKTVTVRTKVVAPRANVQLFEIGGRQVFVPLIAFNALYSWSSGEGQTSATFLLGRDTKGEKMAPFRLDLGPRIFRGVGARLLPTGVRN